MKLSVLGSRIFDSRRLQHASRRALAPFASLSDLHDDTRDSPIGQKVAQTELLLLYRAAPELHRVLAVEGLRITPAERVQAFDVRIVGVIREFLARLSLRVRRRNIDAASFVVYQSVRASMLACMLERPPGLGDAELVEELTDLIVSYLLGPETSS